jgi:hypothetical protein
MDYGIAETGIARGSPPGTTTEVLRFGVPFEEIRVVSHTVLKNHNLTSLNYKVIDIIESYSFHINFISIRVHTKKL